MNPPTRKSTGGASRRRSWRRVFHLARQCEVCQGHGQLARPVGEVCAMCFGSGQYIPPVAHDRIMALRAEVQQLRGRVQDLEGPTPAAAAAGPLTARLGTR